MSDPFFHICMLFVIRVAKGLEKFLIRKDAAHILRRRIAFTAYAVRADIVGIGLRHFLKLQQVQPLVAEIVRILNSMTGREIQVAQADAPVVNELMLSIRIGNTVHAARDLEVMQVIVLPAHDGLNDTMELRQREISGYEDPSPNGRFDAVKGKEELKDLSCGIGRGHCCITIVLQPSQHFCRSDR